MRLAWATDVHLDFLSPAQIDAFADRIAALGPHAVLLSGDISTAPRLEGDLERLAGLIERPIYFVLGNHDFYGGSVEGVRSVARRLTESSPRLRWLPAAGVVPLTPRCALVGQDGWGDGRAGNFGRSRILLNDWHAIAELAEIGAMFDVRARIDRVRALGDASARALEADLPGALAAYEEVIVVTHVPPFEGACWHEGAVSSPDWLPWFTCRAVGDVLLAQARLHPERRLRVYCGHTHSAGRYLAAPNLEVLTGAADYGAPEVTAIDVDAA